MYNEHKQNDYAEDLNGNTLHISEVTKTGRKGYFCPACHNELQAIKPKLRIRSYFRHDAKLVKNKGKCTYSNETYRHKLAKEALQRLKRIKVPSLYKYPPSESIESHLPNLIRKAEFIHANKVEIELTFFEDENGEIRWGRNHVEEKHLLIRPDATFFNNKGKPILFIELIATHKITTEKQIKLKRLGINTVWVKVPKSTPAEIEKAFLNTANTKWAYNYEQEESEYLPIPIGNITEVPEIDEEQRKLFEETFECRAAEIRNLVRSIGRCLESEYYTSIESGLRQDLSRIKNSAEKSRNEWESLQERIRGDVYRKFRERRKAVEDRRTELESTYSNLENRYYRKKHELEREKELVEEEVRSTIAGLGEGEESFENRKSEIGRRIEEARANQEQERRRTTEIRSIIEQQPEQQEEYIKDIRERFRRYSEEAAYRFASDKEQEEKRTIEIIAKREGLPERYEREEKSIEAAESNLLRECLERIKERNAPGNLPLPNGYKELLQTKSILDNFNDRIESFKRIRKARESFRTGAYKSWYRH